MLRAWSDVGRAFTARRDTAALLLTAALVGSNWFVFLVAVENSQIMQSSLGYYINPLVSIVLGFVFLGERLRPVQWAAVALAAAGVVNQVLAVGEPPWVALFLAGTFGLYGLFRKTIAVAALPGFFVEVAVLAPLAFVYMAWVMSQCDIHSSSLPTAARSGSSRWPALITVAPLVLFSYGARRILLATVGLLQFLTPTAHFRDRHADVWGAVHGSAPARRSP